MVPFSQAEGPAGHQVPRLRPGRVGDVAVLLDDVLPQGGGRPQGHQQVKRCGRSGDRHLQRPVIGRPHLHPVPKLLDRRLIGVLGERQISATFYDLGVVSHTVVGGEPRVHKALDGVDEVLGLDRLPVLPHRIVTQLEGIREAVVADAAVIRARHLAGHVRQHLARDRVEAEQGGENVLRYRYRSGEVGDAGVYVVRLSIQPDANALVCGKVTGDLPSIPTLAGGKGDHTNGCQEHSDPDAQTRR